MSKASPDYPGILDAARAIAAREREQPQRVELPPLPPAVMDRILNGAHRAFERDYGVCWQHTLPNCPDCQER